MSLTVFRDLRSCSRGVEFDRLLPDYLKRGLLFYRFSGAEGLKEGDEGLKNGGRVEGMV